jgi:hypothetical protein
MKRPLTLIEVLDALARRVRALETRRSVSAGSWVIEVDGAGQLVARNTQSGTTVILAVP